MIPEEVFAERRRVRSEMNDCDEVIESACLRLARAFEAEDSEMPSMEADPAELAVTESAQWTVSTRWLAALCQAAIDGELSS